MPLLPGARKAEEDAVLLGMKHRLTDSFGVTLNDGRVTLRWSQGGEPVSVTLQVMGITTQSDHEEQVRKDARWYEFTKKHPGVIADLYYAEHGEYPK